MLHEIIVQGCLRAQVLHLKIAKKLLVLSVEFAHRQCMLEIRAHYKLHVRKRPTLCSHQCMSPFPDFCIHHPVEAYHMKQYTIFIFCISFCYCFN